MTTTPKTETAAKKDVTKLQRAIVDGLEDVKAQDIQVFNTEHLSPLFERVIVASGTSNRQTKALAASVRDAVKEAGFDKPRMEGEENGEWIIVDCGAAVAHIMQPAIRQYYRLEEIWGDKPVRLKLGAAKPAPSAANLLADKKAAQKAAKSDAKAAPKSKAKAADSAKPTAKKTAAKSPAKPAAAQRFIQRDQIGAGFHFRLGGLLMRLCQLALGVEHVDKGREPLTIAVARQIKCCLQGFSGLIQTADLILIGTVADQRVIHVLQGGEHRLAPHVQRGVVAGLLRVDALRVAVQRHAQGAAALGFGGIRLGDLVGRPAARRQEQREHRD